MDELIRAGQKVELSCFDPDGANGTGEKTPGIRNSAAWVWFGPLVGSSCIAVGQNPRGGVAEGWRGRANIEENSVTCSTRRAVMPSTS